MFVLAWLVAALPARTQETPNPAVDDTLPLPAFAKKVALHNFGGTEVTETGDGVLLRRLPASVRDKINDEAARHMLYARHSEIRFVLNEGEELKNVRIILKTDKPTKINLFWGDYMAGSKYAREETEFKPWSHGIFNFHRGMVPDGRFTPDVCRLILNGGPWTLLGVEGDVRPPAPDELPPVMINYGTSITMGAKASRSDLAWNALTARELGYDLVNLGASGSAFCEPAIADYIAAQDWDMAVLEISGNMLGSFTVEEFRERADYMVNTIAAGRPESPVVCISVPRSRRDYWTGERKQKLLAFRSSLEDIVRESAHDNVHFVAGPSLISPTGLSLDVLHPSDHGMIEMAGNLSRQIRAMPDLPAEDNTDADDSANISK